MRELDGESRARRFAVIQYFRYLVVGVVYVAAILLAYRISQVRSASADLGMDFARFRLYERGFPRDVVDAEWDRAMACVESACGILREEMTYEWMTSHSCSQDCVNDLYKRLFQSNKS
jgi:hypothetical protein